MWTVARAGGYLSEILILHYEPEMDTTPHSFSWTKSFYTYKARPIHRVYVNNSRDGLQYVDRYYFLHDTIVCGRFGA